MSIIEIKGNIFTTKAQTIVNTVNCVGVMGAGIALEFRLREPEMYRRYVEICKAGKLSPGVLWLYKSAQPQVLNFPTKKDWKHPSRPEYLENGLSKFAATYREKGITSIAFPMLGADKGGLPIHVSREIMRRYLSPL
jgi:O-acetyl-ADP-ribose deacetylase (regulator of RNase III)